MSDLQHPVQVAATLDAASRRADKSVSLRFTTTTQLSNLDFALLDRNHQARGWLLFKPNEIDDSEVPEVDAPDDGKRPSQRFRAVLFIWWKQNTDQSEPFDQFYRRWYERKIQEVKDELH